MTNLRVRSSCPGAPVDLARCPGGRVDLARPPGAHVELARDAADGGPRRRGAGVVMAAMVLLLLAGCTGEPADDGARGSSSAVGGAPPIVFETLASPAPPGSAEPNLTAGPDGFYLSWLERTGPDRHALRFSRLGPDGWTEPGTVMERTGLFVNWADFPSLLVLDDGRMAAHWLEKSGAGPYAYDVRAALSSDGGRTWGEDIIPHGDGVEAEHGFVSLFAVDGAVGAAWLDGRETVHGEPMTLRFTTLAAGGAAPDVLLDSAVCDCCQTDAAMTSEGPIIVYRDRTEGEVRDIQAVRRVAGEWQAPRPVHEDGWVIAACPVNGPAVAASASRVAVAWYTGAAPEPRVLVAFSDDAGATFGAPVRLDEGRAQGRVDLALLDDGSALVTWLESGDAGAEIRVRRVTGDSAGPVVRLAETSAERASGFPRLARRGDEVLFAWTEPGEPSQVRTMRGRLTEPGAATDRQVGATTDATDPGGAAPSFAAVTLDGDSVSLGALRGSPVLLNVWATWCAPCRVEIPELQALHERHADAGLRVIGVTVDARSAGPDVRAFIDQFGMTYEVWWDPDQTSVAKFRAAGVPLTVLIGPDGRIRWRHLGPLEPNDPSLRAAITALL